MILKPKTRLIFNNNWLESLKFKEHSDYDLAGNVDAISIKSESGSVYDFYRTTALEIPNNFRYTALYGAIPTLKALVDFFKFETTRVRIHKQDPGQSIPLHVDDNNTAAKTKEDYRLRLVTALSSNKDFEYKFSYNGVTSTFHLEQGESILFDPDKVAHSMTNNTTDDTRYSLVQIFKAHPTTEWLRDFTNNKVEVVINGY